jgi:hypothetical protein
MVADHQVAYRCDRDVRGEREAAEADEPQREAFPCLGEPSEMPEDNARAKTSMTESKPNPTSAIDPADRPEATATIASSEFQAMVAPRRKRERRRSSVALIMAVRAADAVLVVGPIAFVALEFEGRVTDPELLGQHHFHPPPTLLGVMEGGFVTEQHMS